VPFINDQLNHNNDQLDRQRYEQQAARASRFKFNPEQVMSALHDRIVGQSHALNAMQDMLYTLKADFGDKHRPLSVMLFMGPTGVGKTETVRVLAESILGSADRLCRIDMNTLAQEHYSAALTGSPPGYVGSKEGQTLFDVEKIKGSFSEPGIVLFDEIEKADQSVVRSLMNILDTGKLTLTSGVSEIDFSNSLIFMTSNLGAQELSKTLKNYSQGWRAMFKLRPPSQTDIFEQALNTHFDPEFINRIDQVLPFDWLDNKQLESLLDLELNKLNKRLRARKASVTADVNVRQYLCKAYDTRYGARDIARRIRIELEPKLAQAMLHQPEQLEFKVSMQSGKLKV
jgi:ATP-dependent Clp protease ATP-binding subunit ClpA